MRAKMPPGAALTALLTILILSLHAGAEQAATVLPSPFVEADAALDGAVAILSVDAAGLTELRAADDLVLAGVPVGGGRLVDLQLHRRTVFSPDARLVAAGAAGQMPVAAPDADLFGGAIVGEADSTVFLSLSQAGVFGFISSGDALYVLSSGRFGQGLAPVAYDLRALPDGAIRWRDFFCAADTLPRPAPATTPEGRGGTAGGMRMAEIAIETDYELTGVRFGGNTTAALSYIATLAGAVSEIYERDANVRLEVSYVRLWTDANDPWDQTSSGAQLGQFVDYWEANMEDVPRDDAHFLSPRNLGGGVAYLPGLCTDDAHYALSGNLEGAFPYPLVDNHGQNWDPMVFAHEFGHNFGAPHTHDMNPPIDGCGNGDCTDANLGTIMSYCHLCSGGMSNIVLEFHPRTLSEAMLPYLDSVAGCLDERVPFVDIPQQDSFDTTALNTDLWSYNFGAEVNDRAFGEPSEPYSVDLDTPAPDHLLDDELRSNFIRLAGEENVIVQYRAQVRGAEAGESLVVEWFRPNNTWAELTRIVSDGTVTPFTFHAHQIPASGHHDKFRIRFRTEVDERNDDFHVDDFRINDDPRRTIDIRGTDDADAVDIAVVPDALFGGADGTTPFIRNFVEGTPVVLTAPDTWNGQPFAEWRLAGVPQTTEPVLAFTVTTALPDGVIARAVYGETCDPCDANCDGAIDSFDIEPFIDLVFGGGAPCSACAGDTDGNGAVDSFDIEGFIECLFP